MAATVQQMLQEAKAAYHQLQMGLSPRVVVDGADGSRVEYAAANRDKLYGYIQSLQATVDAGRAGGGGDPTGTLSPNGAVMLGPGTASGTPLASVPGLIQQRGPMQFLF